MQVCPISMDDCLKGSNSWRNIQDIVRTTFTRMNQVLDQHSDAIQQIQNSIRRLEEKNEVILSLKRGKIN